MGKNRTTKRIVQLKPDKYKSLIDERQTAVYLGYGNREVDEEMLERIRYCEKLLLPVLEPRYMFVLVRLIRERESESAGGAQEDISKKSAVCLAADFGAERLVLPGQAIRTHLGDAKFAVAACLTLGKSVDELIDVVQKESMLDALLLDALSNAAVERLRMQLEQDVKETFGLAVGWLFGIGYEDFPLGLQHDFLYCMEANRQIGLSVNRQGILLPLKSVTGFLNVENGQKTGRTDCNGRCGMCENREKCHFFRGVR